MNLDLEALLRTQEPLCDELAECTHFDASIMCTCIKHPLLVEIFHQEQMNALANARLKAKREAVEKSIAKKDFMAVVGFYERPFRLDAIMQLTVSHEIEPSEIAEIILWAWQDSENIHENKSKWRTLIRIYKEEIRAALEPEDVGVFNGLPEQVTVYRGHQHINKNGLSWTLDKEKALWFAKRYHKDGEVAERIVKKSQVAFYTNARGEQEVVIL